jgi:hypothetical protein
MQYEHLIILEHEARQAGKLDQLGKDGWQLVAVRDNNGYPTLYFKRSISVTTQQPETQPTTKVESNEQ